METLNRPFITATRAMCLFAGSNRASVSSFITSSSFREPLLRGFFSYQPLYVYCPCRVRIQSCIISYQWFSLRKTMLPGCFSVLHV